MGTGAITEYMDVAQIVLYAFWILFFILVGYLHREGKREGWPLQMSSGELRTGVGGMPKPKTYRLAHGQGERVKPGPEPAQYDVNATPIYDAGGAPMHPNGDPMVDGVGPAAWATRPDRPDLTVDGRPRSRRPLTRRCIEEGGAAQNRHTAPARLYLPGWCAHRRFDAEGLPCLFGRRERANRPPAADPCG